MNGPTAATIGHETEPNRAHYELYGLSLYAMRQAGKIAVGRTANYERDAAVEQLRAEFDACLFEGLSSDQEFGEGLRVTKFDTLPIIDGRVMSADRKTAIIDLVKSGQECSEVAAQTDSRMWTQVIRDQNDHYNATEVDAMVRGERDYNTRIVISSDPSEAMQRDGEEYWRRVGYIKGAIYLQMYHADGLNSEQHLEEAQELNGLLHGSLSFRETNKANLRAKLSEFSIVIPEDESVDNYINYPLTVTMSKEEAQELALGVRKACDNPSTTVKHDTVTILKENKAVLGAVYENVYLPVAESLAAGIKTDAVKQIADSFLANSNHFRVEIRDHLEELSKAESFDDDDARLLHRLIIYSAIEKMRLSLSEPSEETEALIRYSFSRNGTDTLALMHNMAQLAALGAMYGRSYSSCGASVDIASIAAGLLQETYGGKTCAKEVKDGDHVVCPSCEEKVTAIVHNRGKIECSNKECDLAAEEVKKKKTS